MLKTIVSHSHGNTIASKRYQNWWIDIDPRGAIDHTMQGRTVTSYEPINGLHSMICISDAKIKEGRTRSNDSVALFGPGLISRRWHNGVVSEIACCFGSLPKAHTILHLSPEPDAFLPSWRGTVATVRVSRNCVRSWEREKSRATGAQAKAKAALNKLINYPARGQRGEEGKTGEY